MRCLKHNKRIVSHSYLDAVIMGNADNKSTSLLKKCVMILLCQAIEVI